MAQATLDSELAHIELVSLRLLTRYVTNLLDENAAQRARAARIRTTNAAFRRLSDRAVRVLLDVVGYSYALSGPLSSESTPVELELVTAVDAEALLALLDALRIAQEARPTLEALPPDVLCRVLATLTSTELCAAAASSRALALGSAELFSRFCEPTTRALLRADGAPLDAEGPDWRRLMLAESLWRRVRARAGLTLRATLRAGAGPAHLRALAGTRAMPRDLVCSLLVCDGQEPEGTRCGSLIGGGLRLLSAAEIDAELAAGADIGELEIPLTARDGPIQLVLRACDGSVWVAAGFGRTLKARSWLGLLDRLDTEIV
jgi:hypothetical protein